MAGDIQKIVLAYSGGLDTSVILRWLIETYRCEVVAFVADIGQGEEVGPVREKALRTGASQCHVEDLQDEFVRDFVFPCLRANAVYEGRYLLGTSMARPLIAKGQMAVVKQEGADAVSHGATGKGEHQVRRLTYYTFDPTSDHRAVAEWSSLADRPGGIRQAARNPDSRLTAERPYSSDRNLFHISFEGAS
jgi:argininosuccinate synthase